LLKATRLALIEHLGGEGRLTPTQRALVERAAMLQLRCATLDRRIIDGSFTEYDAKTFLAFSNSLTRTMKALGLEGAADKGITPMEVLQRYVATRESGTAA